MAPLHEEGEIKTTDIAIAEILNNHLVICKFVEVISKLYRTYVRPHLKFYI